MKTIVSLFFGLFVLMSISASSKQLNQALDASESLTEFSCRHRAIVYPQFNYKGMTFQTFLDSNLHYPANMQKQQLEAVILIRFVVDKEGSVLNANCPDSASIPLRKKPFIAEAIRAVNLSSGLWLPAQNDGGPMSWLVQIPITFELEK